MRRAIIFLVFVLLAISGCSTAKDNSSQINVTKTMQVILPHSGENATLIVYKEELGRYKSVLASDYITSDAYVKYEYYAGSSAGGGYYGSTITYSDSKRSYVFSESFSDGGGSPGYGSMHTYIYNCTQGNCGFPIIINETKRRQLESKVISTAPEVVFWQHWNITEKICFSNGNYLKRTYEHTNDKETEISKREGKGCPESDRS